MTIIKMKFEGSLAGPRAAHPLDKGLIEPTALIIKMEITVP
jgi:hypothetical protein